MKLLKLFVSVLLVWILVASVEWHEMMAHLRMLDTLVITLVLLLLTVQFPVSVLKWKRSLEMHGIHHAFWFLQKVLCIGFFFNNFLPTSIGGDAYRVLKTMPQDGHKSRAVAAVLVERLIGFAALILLGFVGAVIVLLEERSTIVLAYVAACVVGLVLAATIPLMVGKERRGRIKAWIDSKKKLDAISHNWQYLRNGNRQLVEIVMISVLFQFIAVSIIWILLAAVGAEATLHKAALLAAIAGVAAVLPLSINGIGMVEGAFAVAAVQLGIPLEKAVLAAFLLRILTVPLSVVCGVIYLLDGRLFLAHQNTRQ